MLELLWAPFLACLVLTAIHVYLGLHVLARGVIFVDLALAQVAALGVTVAFLAGHPIQSEAAYWYALAFTLGGAALFAASRTRRAPVPQEAIIGIVYAVSAAAAVLAVDRAPQGSEHIKQLLVGGILTVTPAEVGTLALLYAPIGALHWLVRRPLLDISFDPEGAGARRAVRAWDFVFYASFGLVVTSSVRLAGVLLVFAYLVVPATAGALLARSARGRLAVGWALGVLVSVGGLAASWAWDLPTGAAVVVAFGALLAALAVALGAGAMVRATRERGAAALRGVAVALLAAVGLAGLALTLFPRMDHLWLDWLEASAPAVRALFLSEDERETYRDSLEGVERSAAELERVRAMQREAQWGTRPASPEIQERMRQYLAGRGEMLAGEQTVLRALRTRARERQRWWLGVPLLALGAGGAAALARRRRTT
ncbi:MAG: metal ABC transporter permease [Candidatus Rokubacteria bacterium]|nr:metal ABC transporter permease [Candidatus Rokubacteria bacterium]